VDPNEGKKIEKGMEVKLSPSTVEVEEYGYIIGYVEKVSEYPSTFQGMLRTLGNIELVKTFTNNGPPIAVTVLLDDDSTTFSGFRWTSTKGPRLEIKSGTLCSSKIITEKRSPISLLFPKMINKASSIIEESLNKPLPFSENELNKENELVDSVVIINTNSFNENALSIKYTIQIAATKRALTNHDLSLIYTGSEKVREEFINGWYKYSIGIFYSKQEALTYIEENGLQGRAFVKIFNNPN